MQTLRACVRLRGVSTDLRQRLGRILKLSRIFEIYVPLQEFEIPKSLTNEKEILVRASLAADRFAMHLNEGADDDLVVEFVSPTASTIFPTLRGPLVIYPDELSSASVLEVTCSYETPLAMLGSSIDTTIGYEIAHRAVALFLDAMARKISGLPESAVHS